MNPALPLILLTVLWGASGVMVLICQLRDKPAGMFGWLVAMAALGAAMPLIPTN